MAAPGMRISTGVLIIMILSTRNTNAGIEKLEEVENKYSDISTAKDRKEDAVAMLTPYSDCHHLLTPAPMTIALLGKLMLIATKKDFSLEDTPPIDGFKYLRYPSSFRASLLQLSNIGYDAFNKAHTNMDQIQLYTANVDSHMKSIVRFLLHGTDTEVDIFVPKVLKQLQHIADTCVTLSEDMVTHFDFFWNVTTELSEASTVAKANYDEKQNEAENAIKVFKIEKERADKEKQELDETNEQIKEDIKQLQNEFKEALKSGPSGWKMFGFGLVDMFSNVVRVVVPPLGGSSGGSSSGGGYDPSPSYEESQQDRSKRQVYKFAEYINRDVQILVSVATSGNQKGEKTPSWNDIGSVKVVKGSLERSKENIQRVEIYTDINEKAMKMCVEGIRLSERLIKMKDQEPESESVKTLIINAEDLLEDTKLFLIEASMFLQNTFMNQNGPRGHQRSRSSSSLVQAELDSYQIKVEATAEVLKDARKRQDIVHKDIKDANERITRTMVKLTEIDIKKINFEKIRETLKQGLKVIADLRTRWSKITLFFKRISLIVKTGLHIKIKGFIDGAEGTIEAKKIQGDVSDQIRNLIYENVFQSSIYAYFVKSISSAYVEVSSKHLMDDIVSLGSLLTLDPETDKSEIEKQYKGLTDKCIATQRTIESLAIDRQKQNRKYLNKRISTIDNELKVLFKKSKSDPAVSSPENKWT